MPFPRAAISDRLNANVDTLLSTLGGGQAARALFLSEVYSPGDSGDASPFLKTLFPEVKIAATIERSLQTSVGRGWDHMAKDIAEAAFGNGQTNYNVTGSIPVVTANIIEGIMTSYTSGAGHATPNTANELQLILPSVASPGPRDTVDEKDDVFFVDSDGFENHLEIKTPKPNYDQGRASKRRILRILAARHDVDARAFVGMPYNPNGLLGEYSWPTTKYMLDLSADLKVGRDLWNFVGDSDDTYDQLLDCFLEVANQRKDDLLDLLREV